MFSDIFTSGVVLSLITLMPIGMKWELQKTVVIPAAVIIGLACGTIAVGFTMFWDLNYFQIAVLQLFIIAIMSVSLLLWRFFRDPEREPPKGDNTILSPADGRIIYIKKTEDSEIPFSEKNGKKFLLYEFVRSDSLQTSGTLIGIAMNFLDVHVNRAPLRGKIDLLKHIKGLFISLKKKEAVIQNERVLTVIDNGYFKVGIVQIASRLVRKIIPYIVEGNVVEKGQRIGVIKFGSQVDLYIPDLKNLRINVSKGDKVTAGITNIATFEQN